MDELALNELLECSVCLEGLDASSKVLPCQHTFCRRCLEEIISSKDELRCPECRTLVTIPVENLPSNILLIRLLEGMKNMKGMPSPGSSYSPTRQQGAGTSAGAAKTVTPKPVNTSQPCAKALYNYEAKEPGDLSFKKGDVVLLRKQVDENWFHGDLNGQHGFFPASYVQVITALPLDLPRCKALYDFVITDKNEKDCLTFQKDEVLTVIRRVDDNWAEGQLGDKIGIFPISFVEMNDSAKVVINTPSKNPFISNLGAPPSLNNVSASTGNQNPIEPPPPVTVPRNPALVAAKQQPQKRHSLTTLSPQRSSPPQNQHHRHSMEIPSPTSSVTTAAALIPASVTMVTTSAAQIPVQSSPRTSASTSTVPMTTGSTASSGNHPAMPPPSLFMALYNYKPQKEDEVELRKGDYYTVTEKCQDGWFKGTCLRTGNIGVFPGNYVQMVKIGSPIRPSGASTRTAGTTQQQSQQSNQSAASNAALLKINSSSSNNAVGRNNSFPSPPVSLDYQVDRPNVPHSQSPRTVATATSRNVTMATVPSSSSHSVTTTMAQAQIPLQPSVASSQSVSQALPQVALPYLHVNEIALPPRNMSKLPSNTPPQVPGRAPVVVSKPALPSHSMVASSSITPPNMVIGGATGGSVGADASPPPAASGREKEKKKDKEKVSLMRRLKGKKSKSPPPNDGLPDVTHSRTGSLPDSSPEGSGAAAAPPAVPQHRKTSSLDSSNSSKPIRPRPLIRERFRCIVPYPPQSDIELELKVGDIVYVHKKRDDGWYKGTLQRTGKTGLFPGSFVESF